MWELHAREERPWTWRDPLAEPEGVPAEGVAACGGCNGEPIQASTGPAVPRLIDDVDAPATPHEDLLVTLAPVGGGLPGRTQAPVPHDQRQLASLHGDLVVGVEMIAVERVPVRLSFHSAAGVQAALARDDERLEVLLVRKV